MFKKCFLISFRLTTVYDVGLALDSEKNELLQSQLKRSN